MGQRSAKFRLPIMLRFFAPWHMEHPLVFLSGSWRCLQHTWDTQLQSFSGHVVMHSSSLRKLECVLNLIMFIHTHIHILHLHRGPIERKKDQTNMIFCPLARKMVVRPPSTGEISFIFMAQKDKCVTVKWQKQLYTASTCFAKLTEIPQWWWSWVHADPVGFVLVCGTVLLTGNHETIPSHFMEQWKYCNKWLSVVRNYVKYCITFDKINKWCLIHYFFE